MPILTMFGDAQREGVFKDMPYEMMQAYTLEVIVSLAKRHAAGTITLDEKTIQMAVDASWDAIRN